jgi:predicted PurR-regulated permease PerM
MVRDAAFGKQSHPEERTSDPAPPSREPPPERPPPTASVHAAAVLLIIAVTIAGLYLARDLLIPVALAAFLAILTAPLARLLERARMGRIASALLVVLIALSLVAGLGWLIVAQTRDLADELPDYREKIAARTHQFHETSTRALGAMFDFVTEIGGALTGRVQRSPADAPRAGSSVSEGRASEVMVSVPPTTGPIEDARNHVDEPVKVEVISSGADRLAALRRFIAPVAQPLLSAATAAVLLVFFLIFRDDLRERLVWLFGRNNLQITTLTLSDIEARLARYFGALALANAVIGIAIGVGLYAMGIPRAPLWGLLAGVLRFVPYVGPVLAALFPTVLAIALFDGWLKPVMVIAWTVTVDTLSANLLEPWLFSRRVGASPTAIVVSVLAWTWLWGGIGLLLAMPIAVCLVVLGKHVPAWEFLCVTLGNEPVLEPKLRLYQRLLSKGQLGAFEAISEMAESTSRMQAYDAVVLPAIAQIEADRHAGLVDDDRVASTRRVLDKVIERLADPPNGDARELLRATKWVVPERGPLNEVLPRLVAQALRLEPSRLTIIASDVLTSELVDRVSGSGASDLVLLVLEPRSLGRILHIFKRLQLVEAPVHIHVALFCTPERRAAYRWRLQRLPGVRVHETIADLDAELPRRVLSPIATAVAAV